jgi:hypothetical protein
VGLLLVPLEPGVVVEERGGVLEPEAELLPGRVLSVLDEPEGEVAVPGVEDDPL